MRTHDIDLVAIKYIDSLGVVAQPIAEVDALNIELREFLASSSTGHEDSEEGVFDITTSRLVLELE